MRAAAPGGRDSTGPTGEGGGRRRRGFSRMRPRGDATLCNVLKHMIRMAKSGAALGMQRPGCEVGRGKAGMDRTSHRSCADAVRRIPAQQRDSVRQCAVPHPPMRNPFEHHQRLRALGKGRTATPRALPPGPGASAPGARWSGKKPNRRSSDRLVPGRGLEPPRCYPLVPETSASTNSATRAGGAEMYAALESLSIEAKQNPIR